MRGKEHRKGEGRRRRQGETKKGRGNRRKDSEKESSKGKIAKGCVKKERGCGKQGKGEIMKRLKQKG